MPDDMQATPEQLAAIEQARAMARAGIPIFVCPPRKDKPGRYFFPREWQNTVADPAALDAWRPGWAVAAVGGGAADFLDEDPRSGGEESVQILKAESNWPLTFATQSTPSGGRHYMISHTGERKETGFMPGLDFQAGADEPDEAGGYGRAFVWLAPTVGRSKITGDLVPYRWVHEPDLDALAEWRSPDGGSSDESTRGIIDRVHAHRARNAHKGSSEAPRSTPLQAGDSQLFGGAPAWRAIDRQFTWEQAQEFTAPALEALRNAQIGEIEERGQAAALMLSHFVPAFLTVEQAFAVIQEALSHTAYDPDGPSDWTDDKFLARLDGRRPPEDDWKAVRVEHDITAASERAPDDAVDALLAEMLTPDQLRDAPPRPYLIKGLLLLDSEARMTGEPGSRKSFTVLDMAAHIALGIPWYGMKVRQGPVIIIAAEGSSGVGARVRAWEAEHGQRMPGTVHVLPRPVQSADVAAWAVLVKACARLNPVLVVADTQARVTVGLEENSAKDMGLYVAAMGAIKSATGACVMGLHHTGKDGKDARGSSAVEGAQDTELRVTALKEALRGELRVDKQKDLPEREPVRLAYAVHVVGADEDGDPVTSLAVRPGDWVLSAESAVEEIEPGQEVTVPEPEPWTYAAVSHNRGVNQRRILQVLATVAGEHGLTEHQACQVVRERWYGGLPMRGRKAGHLDPASWRGSWRQVLALRTARGEELVTRTGGERYSINPMAMSELR